MELDTEILTVSQLNQRARFLLESQFARVNIEGEISNCVAPASGHLYFTLKDTHAQVRCAMFRYAASYLNFIPEEGAHVIVRAKVSLYELRGDYQLIVEAMELAGDGLLQRQFELLKTKLRNEGLFEQSRKRQLPQLPKTIGVITSPTGAVIRDILHVLKRRYPAGEIIIYPSRVQGKEAVEELIEAIHLANSRAECDCLILARGGGSLEDLWAFNDEALARAIFHSTLPIISAVGHETDVTIADFVADLRAPTPSAAAELVCPNWTEYLKYLDLLAHRLQEKMAQLLRTHSHQLNWLTRNLRHPKQTLLFHGRYIDELSNQLLQLMQAKLERYQHRLRLVNTTLKFKTPAVQIDHYQKQLNSFINQSHEAIHLYCKKRQQALTHMKNLLEVVDPMATVRRGYAVVSTDDQQVVNDASSLKVGEMLNIQLAKGRISSQVVKIVKNT